MFDDFFGKNRGGLQLVAFADHCEGGLVQKMWVGDDFRRFFEDCSMTCLKKNRGGLQLFAFFLTTVKAGWSRKCGLDEFRRIFEDGSMTFEKNRGFCNLLLFLSFSGVGQASGLRKKDDRGEKGKGRGRGKK